MSKNPKNLQLTGIIPNYVSSSLHQNNIQASKNEEDSKKENVNPHIQIHQISTSMNTENVQEQNLPSKMNIEQEDENYSFCKEYFKETWTQLFLGEQVFYPLINTNYWLFQNDINYKMREILVDWIISVHDKLNMQKKTLFHCIFLIDAYLSRNVVNKKNLQLLGVTAFLIASKQSEIIVPKLQTLSDITANAYTKKEINDMEIRITQSFDFNILSPTADEFYGLIAEHCEFTEKQRYFGDYFLDASLVDFSLIHYKPSTLAVACGCIVRKFFNLDGAYSLLDLPFLHINKEEVRACVRDLCFCMKNLSNSFLSATKNKYLSGKYLNVAQLCQGNEWIAQIMSS